MAVGLVAIRDQGGPTRPLKGMDAGFFPVVIGVLLLVVAVALLVRGSFIRRAPTARWRLRTLVIVAAVIGAADVLSDVERVTWGWINQLALGIGPPEFAAILALKLAVAVALARLSRLRAAGMILLGLLLAMVGLDVVTGVTRLTMGLEALRDGIDLPVVLLGLIIVGDVLTCLISPSLLVATYVRLVAGWRSPRIPTVAAAGLRVAAALVITAAGYAAWEFHVRAWDVGHMLLWGAVGVAAKIFGWNRLVLVLALYVVTMLEQSTRQAMLLSSGDPMIFLRSPLSAALWLLTAAILGGAAFLSVRRALAQTRPPGMEPAPGG